MERIMGRLKMQLGLLVLFVISVSNVYCQHGRPQYLQQILGGQRKLSDACTYLRTRTSIWGNNYVPFKLTVNGNIGNQIRSAEPIEVSIQPWSQYTPDNFTDFIIYAQPTPPMQMSIEAQAGVGLSMPTLFLGVFRIFPRYAAGGRGFTCDPRAMGHDAFGSAEERRILIKRAMSPNNMYWHRRQPAVRQYASVLWYPTEMAMHVPSLYFTAKIKSDGHWYVIRSPNLIPYIPPDPMATMYNSLSMMSSMSQNMRQFERQADAATAGL